MLLNFKCVPRAKTPVATAHLAFPSWGAVHQGPPFAEPRAQEIPDGKRSLQFPGRERSQLYPSGEWAWTGKEAAGS